MSYNKSHNLDLNAVRILKDSLEKIVKQTVINEIVKDEMEKFEKKIREKITPFVNKVCFDKIESFRNIMDLRDELHVFLHYGDKIVEKDFDRKRG